MIIKFKITDSKKPIIIPHTPKINASLKKSLYKKLLSEPSSFNKHKSPLLLFKLALYELYIIKKIIILKKRTKLKIIPLKVSTKFSSLEMPYKESKLLL